MERYVVIAEWKDEPPTILECQLSMATDQATRNRMDKLIADPRCIRVAVARLEFMTGNLPAASSDDVPW